jgi:TolB-like protein
MRAHVVMLAIVSIVMSIPRVHAESPAQKIRIAVLPFASKDHAGNEAVIAGNRVKEILRQSEHYDLMRDETFQALMRDVGLTDLTECQSSSCLTLVGSQIGVQQILQGSVEMQDTSSILRVLLVRVADGNVLLSRRIVLPTTPSQSPSNSLVILARDFQSLVVESEKPTQWYYVAAALLVVGVGVYFLEKGLADRRSREYEEQQQPPPPPGN